MRYLEGLPSQKRDALYDSPWTCQAVGRVCIRRRGLRVNVNGRGSCERTVSASRLEHAEHKSSPRVAWFGELGCLMPHGAKGRGWRGVCAAA